MKPSPRIFAPVLLGLAALAAAPASLTDETENYRQLEAMPRERRLALLGDLERFDKLPSSEQAKIRKLNAEIASKDPVDQVRYRALMRRYRLWVNGLTEEQQEALRSTEDPETRFELALKFRKQEQEAGMANARVFGIRTGYYGLMGPFEVANLLRIWQRMDAAARHGFENIEGKARLMQEIRSYGRNNQVKMHPFPIAEERKYDEMIANNKEFKDQLRHYADRVPVDPKKEDAAKAKGERTPQRFSLHFTEFLYFEDPAHKPKPVSLGNLEKFSNFCPAWFHAMVDPLSADDARNYLTIVYRVIFTNENEITAEWKPAREKPALPSAGNRPPPKKEKTGSPGPL